jgi:hypothetical protein
MIAASGLACAGPITLTFEGVADNTLVGNFYSELGITFTGANGSIDSDAGGTGNFANEPSASTVIFNTSGSGITMNVAGGFTGPFVFFYDADTIGTVNVKSGANGGGSTLGSAGILNNRGGCNAAGDPNPAGAPGNIACWTQVSIPFSGTALSVTLPGSAAFYMYDSFSFVVPDAGVPEPGSLGMVVIGGLAVLLFGKRLARAEARTDG